MVSQICIGNPAVFTSSDHFLVPSWADLQLPSTIFYLCKMEVMEHAMVCFSFSNGGGLSLTHMNHGYQLLSHSIMDSPMTLIQDEKNDRPYFFSGLLQLLHVDKAILIWHLLIGVTKSDGDNIKMIARHDIMDMKGGTFFHIGLCGGPLVLTIWNSNPASHVDPTANPLSELLKINPTLQNLVRLCNEYHLQIIYWEII